MKHQKRSALGFSHHFLLPILAILIVGGIGSYVMLKSSGAASTTYTVAVCKEKGTIKNGSKGSCVRVAQKVLQKWAKTNPTVAASYKSAISVAKASNFVDGSFGSDTASVVKAFQSKKTPSSIDGKVGKNTWAALSKVSGASGVKVVVGSTSSASDQKKCTYKYKGWNSDWKIYPKNPHCASGSKAQRQYDLDYKAVKVTIGTNKAAFKNDPYQVDEEAEYNYIQKNCRADGLKILTNGWTYECRSTELKK